MDTIRVGVIGCGYWGPNLLRNFIELPDSTVVGVADLKEERLASIRSRYPTVETVRNYQDLFGMNLDAVVIATPPTTHYEIARECIQNGLHVLVEKPLTLDSASAERLIDLAEDKKRVLLVGHTFEYNPAVNKLKEMIEHGDIGQLYYVDAARLNLGLFQRNTNVMWDLAPHDISILHYILGKTALAVSAKGSPCVFPEMHDVVYLNLLFPDNVLGHIHVSWLDPCKVRRVTVVGSQKMVVYNDVESIEKIKIYDKGVEAPPYTESFKEFQCAYRQGDVVIPSIRFSEPLRLECQDFLTCIAHQVQPRCNGRHGLEVIKVLEAAQCSLMNNGHMQEVAL